MTVAPSRGSHEPSPPTYAAYTLRARSPGALSRMQQLAGQDPDGPDPTWAGVTGRVELLTPGHQQVGLERLDAVVARHGPGALARTEATAWAQALLRAGRDDELEGVMSQLNLDDLHLWALRSDLANPFRDRDDPFADPGAEARWLEILNELGVADGMEPVSLLGPGIPVDSAYQRLTAMVPPTQAVDGELVTVVMSAYRPDSDLLLAVRGVMEQTWRNLELLVVDDASPPGHEELLERAAALDPRVRIVRAPRNAGTYAARNLALTLAQGRWMTFQDSDDWTHPRRLEIQVGHLLGQKRAIANRTWTLRSYPDLTLTYPGYPPARLNASSLMFEIEPVRRLVGGFDMVRKSGDMELPLRLNAVRPGSCRDLRHPAPTAITQLRAGSLSRSDAVPGWTRWDRLAHRELYSEWHAQVAAGRDEARLPTTPRVFPLPHPDWATDRPADPSLRVPRRWRALVLGDLLAGRPSAGAALGVARALVDDVGTGAVGVCHQESDWPLAERRQPWDPEVLAAVRQGQVGLTDVTEAEDVDLLVVLDPSLLEHLSDVRARVASALLVVPRGRGRDRGAGELRAELDRWAERSRQVFGGEVALRYACTSEEDRQAVLATGADPDSDPGPSRLGHPATVEEVLPLPVTGPTFFRVGGPVRTSSERPAPPLIATPDGLVPRPWVVGHHLPDEPGRWPATAEATRASYLLGGAVPETEVHVLRGLTVPVSVLGARPVTWLSLDSTAMTVREFLGHLDVFVYAGTWDEEAELAALEALAAGLPCVLPAEAASSGLPATCVPPEEVAAAVRAALTGPRSGPVEPPPTLEDRAAPWRRVVHALTERPVEEPHP